MTAISFERGWVDDLLSCRKQHTTRLETERFRVGDVVHVYIEQRGTIENKPVRQMTPTGTTTIADRVNDINYLYPDTCPVHEDFQHGDLPSYYAHFLGKCKIAEVCAIHPRDMSFQDLKQWAQEDGFDDFSEAYKWFKIHYGGNWMSLTWTVIHWDGWDERYFVPKR